MSENSRLGNKISEEDLNSDSSEYSSSGEASDGSASDSPEPSPRPGSEGQPVQQLSLGNDGGRRMPAIPTLGLRIPSSGFGSSGEASRSAPKIPELEAPAKARGTAMKPPRLNLGATSRDSEETSTVPATASDGEAAVLIDLLSNAFSLDQAILDKGAQLGMSRMDVMRQHCAAGFPAPPEQLAFYELREVDPAAGISPGCTHVAVSVRTSSKSYIRIFSNQPWAPWFFMFSSWFCGHATDLLFVCGSLYTGRDGGLSQGE